MAVQEEVANATRERCLADSWNTLNCDQAVCVDLYDHLMHIWFTAQESLYVWWDHRELRLMPDVERCAGFYLAQPLAFVLFSLLFASNK